MNLGRVCILGDSYSTFTGAMRLPEAAIYYTAGESGGIYPTQIGQTWWHKLIESNHAELFFNDSWSGSTVCNTNYEGRYTPTESFVGRFDGAVRTGCFENEQPDSLFILGGTNDSWANSPIGKIQYENWSEDDLRDTLPAFSYLLHRITVCLPDTKVYVLLNTELREEITNGYTEISKHYGVDVITFDFIDKQNGHPTITGMNDICTQINAYLTSAEK